MNPWTHGAVDAEQAQAFLLSHFGDDIRDVAFIGRGEWSVAYGFRRGNGSFVVRFGALDEDFRKDRLAVRFAAPTLPIPTVIDVGEAFGGFFAVSERASGGFLDELGGGQMRAMLPALFAALDAARAADLSGTTGYGTWGADGNAPHATWRAALLDIGNDHPGDRIHGWRERLAASPTGAAPFDEAHAALRELSAHCPEERYLIHSDLLNRNVLVAGDRISAVIDWGCALYGDFLYDVAWFTFWQPWYPAWQGIDFPRAVQAHYAAIGLEVPQFAERLRACQLHIGLAGQAYQAFTRRWADLEATARRTLEVAGVAGAGLRVMGDRVIG